MARYLIPDQLGAVSLLLQLRVQRLHAAPEEPTLAPDPQNLLVLESCSQGSLLRRSWDTRDERGQKGLRRGCGGRLARNTYSCFLDDASPEEQELSSSSTAYPWSAST